MTERSFQLTRNTKETKISVKVNLDGKGVSNISTGIPFFNHMLDQIAFHSGIDIEINAVGDLEIDFHHTVEDVGIALGSCILEALGDKRGIRRYGFFYIPMDETLTRCVLDLCGRSYFVWNVQFKTQKIGVFDTELVREFFLALCNSLKCNLHIENLYGVNSHHISESSFKALAKSLGIAISKDPLKENTIPSTKGIV
jgi:imidazoleglycerol-phosphate dehydratase